MNITTAWLTITERCNNNCIFCYNHSQNLEMKYSDIKRYLTLFSKLNVHSVVLIGGEPTIHRDFLKVLKYAHKLNIAPAIVSNGIAFSSKEFCKDVIPLVKGVTISLHGLKCTHNKLTNNSYAFDKAVKGIKNILQIDKNKIRTNTTISTNNIAELKPLTEFIMNLTKQKQITFNQCTSFCKNDSYCINPQSFIAQTSKIFNQIHEKHPLAKFKIITPQPVCLVKQKELIGTYGGNCHIFSASGLVIDAKENIIPCTHWADFPLAKLDPNITINEFNKLWKKLNVFRKEIRHYPSRKCVSCKLFKQCVGGCPIIWRQYNPKDFIL